jgi:hypothetical protein
MVSISRTPWGASQDRAPRLWDKTLRELLNMKFDLYGRFQLEVQRENDSWVVYRIGLGKRVKANDLIIPNTLEAKEIATFLDDVFHELSGPGQSVRQLP